MWQSGSGSVCVETVKSPMKAAFIKVLVFSVQSHLTLIFSCWSSRCRTSFTITYIIHTDIIALKYPAYTTCTGVIFSTQCMHTSIHVSFAQAGTDSALMHIYIYKCSAVSWGAVVRLCVFVCFRVHAHVGGRVTEGKLRCSQFVS